MSTVKPYRIIEGNHKALAAFEAEVATAIDEGYSLAGDLFAKTVGADLKFFQPVILDEAFFGDDEEEEEDEEEV